jgi:hypothetical protein
LPIRRRQSAQSVAAQQRTPFRRERDGAAGFRRRSGRIPELIRRCNGYASERLCRSLLSFAFHLATPAISWKRASRRERDAPLQFHADAARIMISACRVRKNIHQNLRIRTVTARPDARALATRAQSGLCLPICADYSAHKLHVRCALHRGCMRAAGICWIAPGKPPLVAYVCGTMLILRSDRDYNSERRPLAARHDALSNPWVCAELGGRVRGWATAAAPHSVAYQVLPDWLFIASHRCAR